MTGHASSITPFVAGQARPYFLPSGIYLILESHIVDYGESHSEEHKHARFGRHHDNGLYPTWSTTNPLHFLGHSLGGPTVTKLIMLLRSGFFPGGHPDMVASLAAGERAS